MTEQSRTFYRISLISIVIMLILLIPMLARWINDALAGILGE